MKRLVVDPADPRPLYQQVAGELRREIADGNVKAGDRLPSAREIAAACGVNSNTVLRALGELRDEGLLEFRPGRGVTITGTPQLSAIVERINDLVELGRQFGYSPDEIVSLMMGMSSSKGNIPSLGCSRK